MLNNEELDKKKKEIFIKFEGVEPFDCTTMEQLDLLEEMLSNHYITSNDFVPRDAQHYGDDLKAYQMHLEKAWAIHKKYNPNPTDEVVELMAKLMWVGIPKPMTITEAKKIFIIDQIMPKLLAVGISPRVANKLSNQIADYKDKHS